MLVAVILTTWYPLPPKTELKNETHMLNGFVKCTLPRKMAI